MSNSRILTTDGKSTAGVKHFGLTVKDRVSSTTPNMTQLTILPASDTIQTHRFIQGENVTTIDAGVTPALAGTETLRVIPDLTLDSTRMYQFNAYVTVVLQTTPGTYLTGHYLLTSASKGSVMIGGGNGYRLDNICSESGIDLLLDEFGISLDINSNKWRITLTAVDDITTSVDVVADITVNSFKFSA
jgi:hypothetical protein